MIKEIAKMHIDNELSLARKAFNEGNAGKVRVCARRAAGIAISYWLESHPEMDWGESAMNLLNEVKDYKPIKEEIRLAAEKLTTSINNKSTMKITADPLSDSNIIIEYFLNNNRGK
jgi:HEPN domain-containing protein